MRAEYILLLLLLCGCAAGVAFFALCFRKDLKKALICLLMSTFVPVAGILLSAVLIIRFKRGHYAMDTEETIRKYKIRESEYIDEERLMNTVPARDALSISTNRQRRSYLLGLLRQHEAGALRSLLHQAVHNTDAEASHYAASAIMELQRLSYNSMAEAGKAYEETPGDYDATKRYAASILDYLDNSEIGNLEQSTFRARCEEVMLRILQDMRDRCDESDYENLIRLYLRQGRYREARDWAHAYSEAHPGGESGYLLQMEAAYLLTDLGAFHNALDELCARSDVLLSHDGLTVIRFWMRNRETGGNMI